MCAETHPLPQTVTNFQIPSNLVLASSSIQATASAGSPNTPSVTLNSASAFSVRLELIDAAYALQVQFVACLIATVHPNAQVTVTSDSEWTSTPTGNVLPGRVHACGTTYDCSSASNTIVTKVEQPRCMS